MGEEIALSSRAWTAGYNIYAPRRNYIAHEYRPGRMGLPKFWGSVGRLFRRPGFNTPLQLKAVQRIKHLIGYEDAATDKVEAAGNLDVLTEFDNYAMGHERSLADYLQLVGIDVVNKKCNAISWCNREELA